MCAAPVPVRSEDSTNSVKSAADLAQEKARQQRQNLPFAKGTLADIDFRLHRLRLKTVDGVRTFIYTERTYIFRGKDKVAADSLKAGEIIAVRFNTGSDGVSTLVRIKAYGPPVPGAPPPGPAAPSNLSP
jgi:Cu/Ag efflux protein CusF